MTEPWLSSHLYFHGELFGDDDDRILLGDVAPAVDAWHRQGVLSTYFFIRYNDGANHIRLRLRPTNGSTERLEAELERLVERSPRLSGMRRQPYEPETERYGGPDGLRVSEQHFVDSSRATLALLRKVQPEDRSSRLGKALLAQLVLLHTFLPDRSEAADLGRRFGMSYLRRRAGNPEQQQRWIEDFERGFDRQSDRLSQYVEVAWDALTTGAPLTPELDAFLLDLRRTRDALHTLSTGAKLMDGRGNTTWEACVQWLLPSYLHMKNNRLGINLREECYLAVLIHRTLDPES